MHIQTNAHPEDINTEMTLELMKAQASLQGLCTLMGYLDAEGHTIPTFQIVCLLEPVAERLDNLLQVVEDIAQDLRHSVA